MVSESPLLDLQKQAGAVLPESPMGAPPVLHFGDPAGEYRACREAAALFDLSDRAQIELTGRDRANFLHNFCTNSVKALQSGRGCEAFVTNVKGKVLGHIFVFAGEESLWVETVGASAGPLVAHLDRYRISEDVEFHDRSAQLGELLVAGPEAAGMLERLGLPAGSLPLYGQVSARLGEVAVFCRSVDWLGVPGYLLSASKVNLADLWRALGELGIIPAGAEAFHALRIEAGFPLYGTDITEDNLAQEVARTKRAISFTKGCYLGQEPIARIDALGHVNRELRGLRLASGPAPQPGASVAAEGKEIGAVTSATVSPGDGVPVALASLRAKHAAPGTRVSIQADSDSVSATVFWPDGLN